MSREFLAGEIEQPIERLISYENGWIRVEPAILLRLSISLKLSLAGFFADLDPSRPELTNWPPGTHKQTKCERHAARG